MGDISTAHPALLGPKSGPFVRILKILAIVTGRS